MEPRPFQCSAVDAATWVGGCVGRAVEDWPWFVCSKVFIITVFKYFPLILGAAHHLHDFSQTRDGPHSGWRAVPEKPGVESHLRTNPGHSAWVGVGRQAGAGQQAQGLPVQV